MVDLSLEQNVNTARQIFQPLINDKNIMSDMAYTKRYNSEKEKADSLRTSTDKESRMSYWNEGVQNLEYWREDYQRTTDEEALKYNWTPRYVPNVDVNGQFQKLMKDSKFKITNTGLSRDGRFIVEQTNGNLMTVPLYNYLMGSIGSDPGVADMYKVMAENRRHEWVNQNAPQFGGDHGAAEDAYYSMLTSNVYKDLKTDKDTLDRSNSLLDAKINLVKKEIDNSPSGVSTESDILKTLESLLQEQQVGTVASSQVDDAITSIQDIGRFTEDRMAKRQSLDRGVAYNLMRGSMANLAETYSELTSETKFKTNPYKLAQEKNAMAIALSDRKYLQGLERDRLKHLQRLDEAKYKQALKAGAAGVIPADEYAPNTGTESTKGAATGQLDELAEEFTQQQKFRKQSLSHQADAVKQFYSDVANAADYETDPGKKRYAQTLLDQTFGKPKEGKLYSDTELSNPEKYYNHIKVYVNDKTFKKNFTNISSDVDDNIKMAELENQAILAYHDITRKNIANLYSYLNANKETIKGASDEDIKMMQAVIDPNLGNTRSAKEIFDKLKASMPNMTMEDAEEIRTTYRDLFRQHYSAGYTVGGAQDPVVRPYEWSPGQPLNTGGRAATPISSVAGSNPDNLNAASVDAREMYRFMRNNKGSGSYTFYKGKGVTADDADNAISSDESSDVYQFLDYALNTLVTDMSNKRAKGKLSEGTAVTLHPIIMNDKDKRGVTFSIPEAVFNKWKKDGKLTNVNYEDFADITVVMPSTAAPGSVFNRFEPKPIRTLLKAGKTVEVTYPNAGTIRLIGRSDGTVSTAGTIKYIDLEGRLQEKPANTIGINANMDPDYTYWRYMDAMKQLDAKNFELINSPYNPANMGEIRSAEQAIQFIQQKFQAQ